MEFIINASPEEFPNAVGEYLRGRFFLDGGPHPDKNSWLPEVHQLRNIALSTTHNHPKEEKATDYCEACDLKGVVWHRGTLAIGLVGSTVNIECRWYWLSNGVLAFRLSKKQWLVNEACQRSSEGWFITDNVDLV